MAGLYKRSVCNLLKNLQINAIGIIKKQKTKQGRTFTTSHNSLNNRVSQHYIGCQKGPGDDAEHGTVCRVHARTVALYTRALHVLHQQRSWESSPHGSIVTILIECGQWVLSALSYYMKSGILKTSLDGEAPKAVNPDQLLLLPKAVMTQTNSSAEGCSFVSCPSRCPVPSPLLQVGLLPFLASNITHQEHGGSICCS